MGLVLTLYKASVWAVVQEQAEIAEAEAMAAADVGLAYDMYGNAISDPNAPEAYYYNNNGTPQSEQGDDTVVLRQNEYY